MSNSTNPGSYVVKQTSPNCVAIHQSSTGQIVRAFSLPPGGNVVVNGSTLEVRKATGQIDLYELPSGRYVRTL